MENRNLNSITVILVVLAAIFAVFHLTGREQVAKNTVQVTAGGKTAEISLSVLPCEAVSGIRVNGKGEEIPVEGQGIYLSNLVNLCPVETYSTVTVISDDSYSAQVSAEEAENACFLVEETELRLVVFGDSNSKRSVSNVKQIIVE